MNKKIIQDMLLSEDSLQDQLQTDQNLTNFLGDSDIHLSQEISDIEKEALDRLKQIRSRISQEEIEYTQQTQASSNALKSKNEIENQQLQSQRGIFSSQSIQKIQENTQINKNQVESGNAQSTNSLSDQYYFKLPPKSSKNNQQLQQINGSTRSISKDRGSVKFEDQNFRIIPNSDSNREYNYNLNDINNVNNKDSFENLKNFQGELKNYQFDQIHSNMYSQSKNEDNDFNDHIQQNQFQKQPLKRLSSETPNSRIIDLSKDECLDSKSKQVNQEKSINIKSQQIQDNILDKEDKSNKYQRSNKYLSKQLLNNQIKDDNNSNFEECDSLNASEIELQQKLSERKKSIDHINKLTEKLNSPSYSINKNSQNNQIPQTPQSNFSIQKNTYDGTAQSAGFEQQIQGKSTVKGLPPFPPSNDHCPFTSGQQNVPVSPNNQFFSTFSSQHRLSTMMNQLTPKQQEKYLPLEKNTHFNQVGKENLITQSPISNNLSRQPTDKQLNFLKKGQHYQTEFSTIKDETSNFQEDTIQELNRKLSSITEQSKLQKEEIHNLQSQLIKPKYDTSKQQDTSKQTSTQKLQDTQKKQDMQRNNENKNQPSFVKNSSSSTKDLMQKITKRTQINVGEKENESNNIEIDISDYDDDMSITEQVLDLKNEINQLKEQIEDKNIQLQKQKLMLLEQRNSLNKKDEEVEDLRKRLLDFELGYNNVQKEVQIIEKQYQVKKLKENQSLEKDLYIQYNEELNKENNELLLKAAMLLEKYKELESEYKKVVNENEQQQHWRTIVQQRDEEVYNLKRELEYIKNNQLSELNHYKNVIDRMGTNLETHKTSDMVKKFIEICSENKKHIEFQKQFYDIISSCQDPSNRRSEILGVKETWELFKKIFSDYLDLRKKDRLDLTLGNVLLKGLQVTSRDEIVPAFTKKIMENEAYNNIIHKVKYHLNVNNNCSLQELSDQIDQQLSKKLYYK